MIRRAISTRPRSGAGTPSSLTGTSPRSTRVEATSNAGSATTVWPVDHARDPAVRHQNVLGMEVTVADDMAMLARGPMLEEPGHGLLQAAEIAAGDPAFQAGEVAVESDRLTADRRAPGQARRLALAVERLEKNLGVERM